MINNTYLNRLNLEFDQISPWEFHYPREPKDLSTRMSSAFKKFYFNNQLVSNNTEKQLGEVVWYSLIAKPNMIHVVKALSTVKDDNNHSMAVLYRCCWKCFFLLFKQSKITTHKNPFVTVQGAFVNFNIWLNLGIFHNISINRYTQVILWVSKESNFMGV